MLLNGKQIKERNLIHDDCIKNYRQASYDLRAGKIIDEKGEILDACVIPPRGLVTVVTMETLCIPDGVQGYATLKNSLSLDGLLALSTGLVDPGWEAPLSSAIVNFGKNNIQVSREDSFLRITFHDYEKDINSPPEERKFDFEEYVRIRSGNHVKTFSNTFLGLNNLMRDLIKENRSHIVAVTAATIGLLTLIAAFLSLFIK
jgi:deoxycytidine triphosphate deaminase